MIKNIVFDMGGVIVDIDTDKAIRRLEMLGVVNDNGMINPYQQKGYFLEYEEGKITTSEFCRRLSEQAENSLSEEQIRESIMCALINVAGFKLDYLRELRSRYKLYLLSNTNEMVMRWARSSGFSSYGKPISDYFDKVYTSYELGKSKPGRAIFHAMIDDSGMKPDETLFIDDSVDNIHTAFRLGFRTYCPVNGEDWREAVNNLLEE